MQLVRHGCVVEAACRPRDILACSASIDKFHRLPMFGVADRLFRAIETCLPSLIVPCDDPARYALTELHRSCSRGRRGNSAVVASIIERSLGNPTYFRPAEEKSTLIQLLGRDGIRVPATTMVPNTSALENASKTLGFPMLLKADRTWGGTGVVQCDSFDAARQAFARLSRPVSLRDGLRHAVYRNDLGMLVKFALPEKPTLAAQAFIEGRAANRAVICQNGRVLAGVTVLVHESNPPNLGPACIVELIEDREIEQMVEAIARRLELSGVCGFDFVIEQATGKPFFLELNARATPTCFYGRTARTSICSAIECHWGDGQQSGPSDVSAERDPAGPIAVFPSNWILNPARPSGTIQDGGVPWSDPAVMAWIALEVAISLGFNRRSRLRGLAAGHLKHWLLKRR